MLKSTALLFIALVSFSAYAESGIELEDHIESLDCEEISSTFESDYVEETNYVIEGNDSSMNTDGEQLQDSDSSSNDITLEFVKQVHENNRRLIEGTISISSLYGAYRGTWAIIPTTTKGLVSVPSGSTVPGTSAYYVKLLQSCLNSLGFNAGTPDGVYGPKTAKAIKNFQTAQGITSDGIAGQITWAYIDIRIDTYGITVVF